MKLNFKTFGQGPALIILHGLFGSLDNWVSHARTLAENYSVYIIDQRNHGKSPHALPWDYPTMAEDLNDFMDQQGIFQASLLGHSMGGKTVLQFAMEYPERIEKLIVADMSPKAYEPHHTELLEALINLDLMTIGSRREANEVLEQKIEDITVRQFLLKSLGRDENKNFKWKFNLRAIYDNYPNVLDSIDTDFGFDGQTLFVYGGKSNYLTSEDLPIIKEDFTEAVFEKIPHAGHWLHADTPEEFLLIVKNFLNT